MTNQLKRIDMNNYGIVRKFSCDDFSNINLIIGKNGSGKTFLLKSLYSAVKAMEEYHRGDDISSINEILANKLRWTFQVEKLGDIVSKDSKDELTFNATIGDDKIGYQFTQSSVSSITKVEEPKNTGKTNSIFIPAKEVLSLFSIILKSRNIDKSFGFDDTYYDLAKALTIPKKVENDNELYNSVREKIKDIIDGKVEYDEVSRKWYFKNNKNQKYAIGATSDGNKKFALLERLLSNGYISNNSMIFIDELECDLHPQSICTFLDLIDLLASKTNIQFFITSNSYFVIKKLALMAMNKPNYVKCISLSKNEAPGIYDLKQSMPKNSIIDTSIQLYEEEIRKGI